jgi:WD40 repeat protein
MMPNDDSSAGHAQRIFALKYHPEDNNVFISAGWDNVLRIWDMRTIGGLQRLIVGPHIAGDGLDLKGNQILTASWIQSNALQLWDYRKGTLLKNLPFNVAATDKKLSGGGGDALGGGAYLYCGQFCTDNVVVAGGSGTNSIQAVSLDTEQVLTEIRLNKPVYALDSAQNGRLVAVGGAGEKLLLSVMS